MRYLMLWRVGTRYNKGNDNDCVRVNRAARQNAGKRRRYKMTAKARTSGESAVTKTSRDRVYPPEREIARGELGSRKSAANIAYATKTTATAKDVRR